MSFKSSHFSIEVRLDKPFYYVGNTVNGTVEFSVKESLRPLSLSLLYFCKVKTSWQEVRINRPQPSNYRSESVFNYLHNNEEEKEEEENGCCFPLEEEDNNCCFTSEDDNNRRRQRRREPQIMLQNKINKSILHSYNIPLANWNIDVEVGKYSFPFSFLLPENLPGTFLCQTGMCSGKIKHINHIKLISNESITKKYQILVVKHADIPLLHNSFRIGDLHACLKYKGYFKITVTQSNLNFITEDIAEFLLHVDNSSSDINIKLIKYYLGISISITVNEVLMGQGSRIFKEGQVPVNILARQPIQDVIIQIDLKQEANLLKVMYSTKTSHIQARYFVDFQAVFNSRFCNVGPTSRCFINILPQRDLEISALILPNPENS